MDFTWTADSVPMYDEDSSWPLHQGHYSIPPFQMDCRFLYAYRGEQCCGTHFRELFCLQFHPDPHCPACRETMIRAASYICWQCRTYFRRYGTTAVSHLVGPTPQRHDFSSYYFPARGPRQHRLAGSETFSEIDRQASIFQSPSQLMRRVLQHQACPFRATMDAWLAVRPVGSALASLPTLPIPPMDVDRRFQLHFLLDHSLELEAEDAEIVRCNASIWGGPDPQGPHTFR